MKTPVHCLVIAAAGAAGLCGGWVLWGGKENDTEGVVSRAIASGRPVENGPRKADCKAPLTAGPVGSHAAEVMASELDIIKALTPQEFGIAMTDLWLAAPTPDNLVRRGLYLASCNGECGEQFDNENNMAVCCAGCNGLKGECLPPATHPCWKSRKTYIKECSRFIAECRLKNFQKYKTHVEKVLKKRAGQ